MSEHVRKKGSHLRMKMIFRFYMHLREGIVTGTSDYIRGRKLGHEVFYTTFGKSSGVAVGCC